MPRLHVLHVVLSLDAGGLEHVVLHLIREGKALGQQATVVCLERPGTLASEAESLGARIVCTEKRAGLRLSTIGNVQRILHACGPDVVHTHQIGALFYAGVAAQRCRVPVIVHTEHGKHYDTGRRKRWMARWAARRAHRFFCVSRDIAESVVALRITRRENVEVVENGIDLARYKSPGDEGMTRKSLGIPEMAPVIGTVGRLAAVKRQDILLRSFACIPATTHGLPHLVIVGSGALEPDLRALATELGIASRVHFAGYQPDPAPYLRIMDIFALTSDSEGMPLSVLEAWAAGIPVIASRVGGLPELIEEGRTGILFERGDCARLADLFMKLLAHDQQRRDLSRAGNKTANLRYSAAMMAQSYHVKYLQLAQRARGVCSLAQETPGESSIPADLTRVSI